MPRAAAPRRARRGSGAAATCRRPCARDADCDGSRGTSRCVLVTGDDGAEVAACSIPCDALGQGSCPAGDACDLFRLVTPARSAVGVVECRPVGAAGLGDECAGPPPTCRAGLTCEVGGCHVICGIDRDGPTACPEGTGCVPDEADLSLDGLAFGTCFPP